MFAKTRVSIIWKVRHGRHRDHTSDVARHVSEAPLHQDGWLTYDHLVQPPLPHIVHHSSTGGRILPLVVTPPHYLPISMLQPLTWPYPRQCYWVSNHCRGTPEKQCCVWLCDTEAGIWAGARTLEWRGLVGFSRLQVKLTPLMSREICYGYTTFDIHFIAVCYIYKGCLST